MGWKRGCNYAGKNGGQEEAKVYEASPHATRGAVLPEYFCSRKEEVRACGL